MMRVLRSIAAVVCGLGFMAATVTVGTLVASALIGTPQPVGSRPAATVPLAYLVVNLAICAVGAVLGGWLAARIATFAPYAHASVMAAVVAVLSVTTATGVPDAGHPGWVSVGDRARRRLRDSARREAEGRGSVGIRSRGSVNGLCGTFLGATGHLEGA